MGRDDRAAADELAVLTLPPPVLLGAWVKRDFRIRYIQTSLGALWALAQPLALTITFVFLFNRVAGIRAPVPYASFVLPAMLLWTLFAAGVANGALAMSNSMYIASKADYPRVVAPLAGAILPLADLAAGLVLMPVVLLVQHAPLHVSPLALVASVVGTLVLSSGVACLLSAVAIFVRDVRNITPLALQLLLLVTPVAYPSERLPQALRHNPMATFVSGFRSGVVRVPGPTLQEWVTALAVSVAVLALGLWYFDRVQARFADVA